ncbi:nicotinate-nucleotide--dimethylbenzimidazole phosphoribosyltransferase [Devosia psychrophila]|uniref:Nicotinate-nucleotide--dimethylbenzimidazole phosphoribosyltransferase n=1 Tax=Devosia psychrophila TaxID=728005 RepID=A0A0F5Q072_9HYPH|nr:nicotinate-nucleotide--dimethylbenzimidazole phosphoribosyltransferase [Devosia psychrophila]KKC34260.1 nicotinate-nucleotide--dimethylbenzimidazole phosphoribosyltransferase [Devosia psychrophila]SFC42464.1 nicotinate-nucleotide-dimethylbenzimidazole phosphoribosyltransferase [Devosia psychrophila]
MPTLNPAYSDVIELLTLPPDGDESAVAAVRARDAQLTKPPGSLGALEGLVEFLARWQGRAKPRLDNPMVTIFAANHGVTDQGVSTFPRQVTAQMVANFTNGGAAISQICALHELNLRVFELALELPTGDITKAAALDDKMCAATIAYGMEAIAGKPDLICLGEMGIGNTTVAAAIYAALYGGTGADWVGRGTGVDDAGLARKADSVDRALAFHAGELDHPLAILARVGGREIAAMLGALIAARHQKVPVIVDGFVATSAAAIAHAINPASIDHCLFAHVSAESGHARALQAMGQKGLLDLGMRLGEGSGAALAAVLAKTALHLHNNMATFESASVSGKEA